MRRKTLHNNLKDLYDEELIEKIYEKADLDSKIRAQELSLSDFLNIYDVIRGYKNEG